MEAGATAQRAAFLKQKHRIQASVDCQKAVAQPFLKKVQ
jgi:hypothetical protein